MPALHPGIPPTEFIGVDGNTEPSYDDDSTVEKEVPRLGTPSDKGAPPWLSELGQIVGTLVDSKTCGRPAGWTAGTS